MDSTGRTIEFLLTAKRDAAAAKRFFRKALNCQGNPVPRVINVDKNPAFPPAMEALKGEGILPRRVRLRQCKYLNKCGGAGPSHGKIADLSGERERLVRYGMADLARNRGGRDDPKGRVRWVAKEDAIAQASFIAELFGIAA